MTAHSRSPSQSPFGPATQRYWELRHTLFHRFDEGICLDEQGLYSVKPEAIALHVARTLPGDTVLDAFCGVGGSAIGFARAGRRVLAVEIDAARLEMAKHNARLYGVADRIAFAHGDARDALRTGGFDAVNLDPPWGGPDYYKLPAFRLADFAPDGAELLRLAFATTPHVALCLPKNFAWAELASFDRTVRIERNVLGGRLLFRTAYFGPDPEAARVA